MIPAEVIKLILCDKKNLKADIKQDWIRRMKTRQLKTLFTLDCDFLGEWISEVWDNRFCSVPMQDNIINLNLILR